jgi:hypothetical protein
VPVPMPVPVPVSVSVPASLLRVLLLWISAFAIEGICVASHALAHAHVRRYLPAFHLCELPYRSLRVTAAVKHVQAR